MGVIAGAAGPIGVLHSSSLVDASTVDLAGALAALTGLNTRVRRELAQRQGLFQGQQRGFGEPHAAKHPPDPEPGPSRFGVRRRSLAGRMRLRGRRVLLARGR